MSNKTVLVGLACGPWLAMVRLRRFVVGVAEASDASQPCEDALAREGTQRLHQRFHSERLGQRGIDAHQRRGGQIITGGALRIARDDHDRQARESRMKALYRLETVHVRHEDIGYEHVGMMRALQVEGLLAARGDPDAITRCFQRALHRPAQYRVIVDYEHTADVHRGTLTDLGG